MRPAADYAAQSDPDRNWNFSRAWEDPPPRRNAPVDGQGASETLANGVTTQNIQPAGNKLKPFGVRPRRCFAAPRT
jgi:hypothetical protein